jgi:hypothetical protein
MRTAINTARAISIYLNTETENPDKHNKVKQGASSYGIFTSLTNVPFFCGSYLL